MSTNGHTLKEGWQPDLYCDIKSWVHEWDPRTKIISMVIFIFGIVSLNSLMIVLLAFGLAMMTVVSTKIPFSFFLKRVKWVVPFLIFIFVGLLLGRGLENFVDSMYFGTLVSLKALTSIIITILVLGSQPLENFLKGLSQIKVPKTIISVLFLSYRYVYLYREIFLNTHKALISRGFTNKFSVQTLKVYGEVIGAMFIKALDRSEIVFKSMESRGFDGNIPIRASSKKINNKDVLKTTGVVFLTFLLLSLDWGII